MDNNKIAHASENQPVAQVEKRKRGRKTKRTPERIKRICDLIASGQTIHSACRMSGVESSTVYAWARENPLISQAIHEAEGRAEQVLIELAMQGAKKDGRIALMMLERRYPHWRKKEAVTHTHTTGETLKVLTDARKERDRLLLTTPIDVETTTDNDHNA